MSRYELPLILGAIVAGIWLARDTVAAARGVGRRSGRAS